MTCYCCCREAVFRQLCALHWLLEAMNTEPPQQMSPLTTSWNLKYVCLFIVYLSDIVITFTNTQPIHYRVHSIIHYFQIHNECSNNCNAHIEKGGQIVNTCKQFLYKYLNIDSVKNRFIKL